MSEETKTCPFCAEEIKADAIVCKHCGRNLDGSGQPVTTDEKDNKTYKGIMFALFVVACLIIIWMVYNYVQSIYFPM